MSSTEPGSGSTGPLLGEVPAGPAPGPVPGGTTPPPPGPTVSEARAERPPSEGRDWTFEVTDRIGAVVGAVRDKTTVPITKVARALVFGLLVATGGIAALILFIIALVRLIDVYLPVSPYARRVWIVYLGLAAIFLAAGAFAWSRRKVRR